MEKMTDQEIVERLARRGIKIAPKDDWIYSGATATLVSSAPPLGSVLAEQTVAQCQAPKSCATKLEFDLKKL